MFFSMREKFTIVIFCCFLFFWLDVYSVYAFPSVRNSQEEVVNRIAALVNEEVITLTDVKIVKAFNLFPSEGQPEVEIDISYVLKKIIDQNLVIQLTQDDNYPSNGTVDEFIDQIIAEMGVEEFRRRLDQFGMARPDLAPYARKWLAYQKIIADRFKTSGSINLKEIEDYYERKYVPAQKAKGLEAKPMLEILDEIEAVIKEEKNKMQVEEWLENLRQRADIQINL